MRYGRRLGWYMLVRALRPEHVVATGTDKGLRSTILAAALARNRAGRLTTIDADPGSDHVIPDNLAAIVTCVFSHSLQGIAALREPVDLFLHDSLHTREHELAEFAAVEPHLTSAALVLSDNAHATDALSAWAESTGRRYWFFKEEPADHWYPGDGIGAARA